MLGFHPQLTISYDWTALINDVQNIANEWVHTNRFKENLIYQQGASLVATLPTGGWISKSESSKDFFVYGGVTELELIGNRFRETFPDLTFTPPTMGYTSDNIPEHRDHVKNGRTSLVYPLCDNASLGRVFDPKHISDFYYMCLRDQMIAINISERHLVYVHEPRIWFNIHCQEPPEYVKETFDKLGKVVLDCHDT